MASRPDLNTALVARLEGDTVEPFMAIKAEFDTDDVRLWSGKDDLTINGEAYTGAGELLNISKVDETNDLSSQGVTVSLSYMDETVLGYALDENYQNRPLIVYLGFVMGGSSEVVGVINVFTGRMTSMVIKDTPDGAGISLNAESRLVTLNKPRGYRYTNEAQDHLFAGDIGLQYIQKLQEKQIRWGMAGLSAGTDIPYNIGKADGSFYMPF